MREKGEAIGDVSCLEWCNSPEMDPVMPGCLGGWDKKGRVVNGIPQGERIDCTTVLGEGRGDIVCFCMP
jgi:hypothetical protein